MSIKLITVTSHPEHAGKLIVSAQKQGWDLVVIHVPEWKGFGTKIIETYNWLKANPEVKRFVFADAFDVICVGTPHRFLKTVGERFHKSHLVFSAEKGCWPAPQLAPHYPKSETIFKYLNSGLYYSPANQFKTLVESTPLGYDYDDQLYFTIPFLKRDRNMRLDYRQSVFNSHSFVGEGEYSYEDGKMKIWGHEPCFVHFNGKTIDPEFDKHITI